jgi:drug/metabolite transporter (DMT)-like permease
MSAPSSEVTPILAGLGAAAIITVSALASARASRLAGSVPTVAGAMLVGFVVTAPLVALDPPAASVPPAAFAWAALSGIANVIGLLLAYAAYRRGTVGVVATIASTEGAIAAALSLLAGEALPAGTVPALVVITTGVVLAAAGAGGEREEGHAIDRASSLRAAGLATVAALCFGVTLFALGRASADLPLATAVLPARAVGTLALALPLVLMRRFRIPRAAVPYIVATGFAEIGGLGLFVIGARIGIAVTAVLASLFAPLAALAAFILFRERLTRRQVAGIAVVTAGVAALGALNG